MCSYPELLEFPGEKSTKNIKVLLHFTACFARSFSATPARSAGKQQLQILFVFIFSVSFNALASLSSGFIRFVWQQTICA